MMARCTPGENHLEFVEQASPNLGLTLLWAYIMLAQVLLVNLLIAMMGSTYTKYSDNAEQVRPLITAGVALLASPSASCTPKCTTHLLSPLNYSVSGSSRSILSI